jgi:hypothetical protein
MRAYVLALAALSLAACDDKEEKLKASMSRQDALTIQKAAEMVYKPGGDCPTVGELELPREFKARGVQDAWGNKFRVVCEGSSVSVVSAGPDKKEGTEDDIRSK